MGEIKINDFPRLDLVLFIEKYIKNHDGEFNRELLLKRLSKKIKKHSLIIILDFLIYSKKISVDSKGKIGWIYYPKNLEQNLTNTNLFWRKDEASI